MNSGTSDPFLPLIPMLRKNDPQAQEELFHHAWIRLKAWASCRFYIAEKDVEDFAIVVVRKALAKLDHFDPSRGSFAGWLYVLARNHATDHSRRLRREPDVLQGALTEETLEWMPPMPAGPENPPPSVLRRALDAALNRLSGQDQELLRLTYSGMNATKIATLCRLTPDNVRQRHRRLLNQLRDEINRSVEISKQTS